VEVGGNENGHFCNFLTVTDLHDNSLSHRNFRLLFGFIWFWKIRLFFIQNGTDLAQAKSGSGSVKIT
jgi:hypothetical protein